MTLARILMDLTEEDLDFSPQIEAAWDDEIGRRLHAVRTGAARARSVEQVFAELDRRFPNLGRQNLDSGHCSWAKAPWILD